MMKSGFLFLWAILLCSLWCCRNVPDFEKVPVHFVRFDRVLFAMRNTSVPDSASVAQLRARHGEFLNLYSERIIRIGSSEDPGYTKELSLFLNDSLINAAHREVEKVFPNMSEAETQLSNAFGRYKSYFPNKKVPRCYAIISGFNESAVTSDSLLAISLDKYLGSQEPLYTPLGLPRYMTRTMSKEYLPADCLKAWGYTEFPFNDSVENVLSHMLYEGQIMYFVKQLLPNVPDTLLFRYSTTQLKWCQKNEANMWANLSGEELLFSTDYLTIRKLIGEGPFTSLFVPESPGRAVVWLGYQIIESFMEHQHQSLSGLMSLTDYRKILNQSRFRP